jgi:hypothetical protein
MWAESRHSQAAQETAEMGGKAFGTPWVHSCCDVPEKPLAMMALNFLDHVRGCHEFVTSDC